MYCNNCGHKNDEGTTFCTECGSKLELGAPIQEPACVYCDNCGSEITNDSKYCEKCGASLTGEKKKKTKFVKMLVALIAAIAVMCCAVFGFTTLSNPVMQLRSATKKTLGAKNAEFAISVISDYDRQYIDGEVEVNTKKDYFCLHVDMGSKNEGWFRYNGGYEVEGYYRNSNGKLREDNMELSDDEKLLFDILFDAANGKVDNEKIAELYSTGDVSEIFNIESYEKECERLAKKLVSKKNLKKIFGFEKIKSGSETVYSFSPDVYELLMFFIDNGENLFTHDAYLDVKEAKWELDRDELPEIEINFTVKGGYLVGCEMNFDAFGEEGGAEVRLNNINKTKVEFPGDDFDL